MAVEFLPGNRLTLLRSDLYSAFPERRYEDPLVAAIRFAGDTATIEFREKGLSARAYPLPSPDRLVIEVGRAAAAPRSY